MDLKSLDKTKVKITYMVIAALLMVGAIISAFYDQEYIALAFIVAASAVILIGAFLMRYLHEKGKIKDLD